jgi:hypothetical protein
MSLTPVTSSMSKLFVVILFCFIPSEYFFLSVGTVVTFEVYLSVPGEYSFSIIANDQFSNPTKFSASYSNIEYTTRKVETLFFVYGDIQIRCDGFQL